MTLWHLYLSNSLVMIIPSLGEVYFGKEPISCCDDQLDLKIM